MLIGVDSPVVSQDGVVISAVLRYQVMCRKGLNEESEPVIEGV